MHRCLTALSLIPLFAAVAHAAPTDARPAPAPIPPIGITLTDAERTDLTDRTAALGREIGALRAELKSKPALLRFLPDVEIYDNAVRYPLTYHEFYSEKDVATAGALLDQGMARVKSLRAGSAPWTRQTGLVALGYRSRIDGSIQPYGILVPATWSPAESRPHRLDFFLHGRDEHLTELHFIDGRQRSAGEFTPADAFVLQPYGRYCNANRFAGEVDAFEALDDAKTRYSIDPDRVVMRGFSMGGASCWQYATHHGDEWAAAAPGAGFTETAVFTNAFAPGKTPPAWYEQTLWHWYDSVDYAVNLAQCPTVAYSGEIDGQRKAAVNMAAAMEKEGLALTQVIGPNTAHRYAPESKPEINAFVDRYAATGRNRLPDRIRFTTFTLRYNRMDWMTVDGMDQQWKRARVEAARTPGGATLTTENVSALSLTLPEGAKTKVTLDNQSLTGERFAKNAAGRWTALRTLPSPAILHKRHGLQGPIDDAFMDRFLMVRPTGKPLNAGTDAWVQAEMAHAVGQWRAMFRGDAPMADDSAVTPAEIAGANLVLWGDPSSNRLLARIAPRLPIVWGADGSVRVGAKTYPAGSSVPVLIYPNPLNPARYVVLNSGITFREGHYSSNALQTPKLPDWAIVDLTTPPDAYTPGRIADAGFFDEDWRLSDKPRP
jgi:pimeloyl-ACP methyl ester carboxylesterase